jgi:hypothetical protein
MPPTEKRGTTKGGRKLVGRKDQPSEERPTKRGKTNQARKDQPSEERNQLKEEGNWLVAKTNQASKDQPSEERPTKRECHQTSIISLLFLTQF